MLTGHGQFAHMTGSIHTGYATPNGTYVLSCPSFVRRPGGHLSTCVGRGPSGGALKLCSLLRVVILSLFLFVPPLLLDIVWRFFFCTQQKKKNLVATGMELTELPKFMLMDVLAAGLSLRDLCSLRCTCRGVKDVVDFYFAHAPHSAWDPRDLYRKIGDDLGCGGYGTLYRGRVRISGEAVDIRVVYSVDDRDPTDRDSINKFQVKMSTIAKLGSPALLGYRCSFWREGDELWIISDFSGSCVWKFGDPAVDERTVSSVCREMLGALEVLHSVGVFPSNLCASHISRAPTGQIVLLDYCTETLEVWGSRRNPDDDGSPYILAPELLVAGEFVHDSRSNIWSLGIDAYTMATGSIPHSDIHPMRFFHMAPTYDPPRLPEGPGFIDAFRDFVARCLQKDPAKRATIAELRAHPFIVGRPR